MVCNGICCVFSDLWPSHSVFVLVSRDTVYCIYPCIEMCLLLVLCVAVKKSGSLDTDSDLDDEHTLKVHTQLLHV